MADLPKYQISDKSDKLNFIYPYINYIFSIKIEKNIRVCPI